VSAAITIERDFEATALSAQLEAAVVQVVERIGQTHGLPPIRWTVVDYPEGPVVEGRPIAARADAEEICARWASAMKMTENSWDSVAGERSWRLDIGTWHLELIACQETGMDPSALFDQVAELRD